MNKLMQRSAWKINSPKFGCRTSHRSSSSARRGWDYIGEAEHDFGVAEEAAHLIEGITDPADRVRLHGELAAVRQLLEDWLAFIREPGADDFDEWCRLRGRQYVWTKHYYY